MEYLLAAIRRQRRRMRFEQWLLLAIRTLIVVLIVLAVAEPYWRVAGFAAPGSDGTHRVLVVDGSFSMAYTTDEKTRFQRAKELIRQMVENSRQGDAFTLVLMSSPPRVIVGNPVFDGRDFLGEVDDLELPHTTADVPTTLLKVEDLLKAARLEHERLEKEEIYFLTDLGRVGWLPEGNEEAVADFHQLALRLAERARFFVIDLGQSEAENAAITAIRTPQAVLTPGDRVSFDVAVKNFGGQGRTGQPIELLVDGRRLTPKTVDLTAGQEVTESFSHRFTTAGEHVIEARTAGDALDIDNHRWMVLPVRESVRVLCLDGRPSGEAFAGATDYLAFALAPHGRDTERAVVEPEIAPEGALLHRDLKQYDCVFLCNVNQFTSHEASVLRAYLGHGGNLIFFLGERVLPKRYNRELGGDQQQPALLPAALGNVVSLDQPQPRLDPLDYEHPLLDAFRGVDLAGLLNVAVMKYVELDVGGNKRANVVLRLGNGDPLIVEQPVGRGRVVLVATSAGDTDWTLLPIAGSFVPLVQEIMAWCVRGQRRERQVEVGEPLRVSVPAPAVDASVTVGRVGGDRSKVRLHADGDYAQLAYTETWLSGVYAARFGSPIDRTSTFAVNVDTAESDLTAIDDDALHNRVFPGVEVTRMTKWREADAEADVAGSPIPRAGIFDVVLLYLVLGLLFVETVLGWLFGYHAA